jgi:general secretion pathway protein I
VNARLLASDRRIRSQPRGLGRTFDPSASDGGFTLLEVLVALAILGLAVTTAIQLFAGGLRLLKQAGDHQRATLIADQKARELSILEEGRETGTEGPFAWERKTMVADVPAELTTAGSQPYHLYSVTVRVSWGGGSRAVDLVTLRTAPEPVPGALSTSPSTTTNRGTTSNATTRSGTTR